MPFPQLLVTPFIYKRKEVFQLARPYQILTAWYETHPESLGMDEFIDFADDLGKYLQFLDGGGEIKANIHEDFKRCLVEVLSKAPTNELLNLARITLETGHDPYKLTIGTGDDAKTCEIMDVLDDHSEKI